MAIARYSPAKITIGLSAVGAVFGAGAGGAALAVASVFTPGFEFGWFQSLALVPLAIGAVLGALCAPIAGWWLLRRVPLGRMFLGLSLGTVAGGVIGWFLPSIADAITQPVVTAAIGFLTSALVLRWRF